ncbi:hypothetical protein FRC00_007932 [Tulasnella sp. 408]|nr:hypothetical protein FRC00_007932 [Tulasnella sp. 408]
MATSAREPPTVIVSEAVEPPHEFGQDGGKFYRCYDAFAEEIDEDMTTGLKEQLDGLLVFAGLFVGANTAFLAFTLPHMSADPADDTNALLQQTNAILLQMALQRNISAENLVALPSATFSPPKDLFVVNVLFAVSLSFALISSFLAVLGRQWLVYYRKRGGGGPDRQRWEQFRRYLGAERWRLELVLDDILPTLLQIGLILFCTAIVIYLDTLDGTLSRIVGGLLAGALGLLLALDLCVSTLRAVLTSILGAHLTVLEEYDPNSTLVTLLTSTRDRLRDTPTPLDVPKVLPFGREDEDPEQLKLKAIKRVIKTSDDPIPVSHATANIIAIEDRDTLQELWSDEEFCRRLIELSRVSGEKTTQHHSHSPATTNSSAGPRLTCGALIHIFLMGSKDLALPASRSTSSFFRTPQGSPSALSIPSQMVHKSSSTSIKVSLVWKYILDREGFPSYVNEILKIVGGDSGDQNWQLPVVFTPSVVSLMALAASRAEMSDIWTDVRGPYTAKTRDMAIHIADALIRRLISRHGRGNSRSEEDCMLVTLLRIAIRLVPTSSPDNMNNARTGIFLLALGDSVMLLRDPNLATPALNLGKSFREDSAVMVKKIFQQISESAISAEFSSELAEYFRSLLGCGGRESTHDEDFWVVSLFSPILRELRDPFARSELLEALGEFKGKVYMVENEKRVSMERRGKRDRDPEVCWCHCEALNFRSPPVPVA